jgi:CheY-like chemotaxis protein
MVESENFRQIEILVVDDQLSFRTAIEKILVDLRCNKVRLVDCGLRALSEVCRRHPDVIFMDLVMPGMDGLTASTIIRNYEADVRYRAFMVGLSNGKVDWRDYCIEAGMDLCLRKPVCHRDLEQLLQNLVVRSASSDTHQTRTPFPPNPVTHTSAQKKLRIIYAEDSPTERELLTKTLSMRGHDVVCHDNGKAALQAILTQPFDVLVTDNDMPCMNGLDLVRELLRLENPIKIVVTSGYLESEVEVKYRDLGVKRFLPKPSPDEKLFRAVESE